MWKEKHSLVETSQIWKIKTNNYVDPALHYKL